MIPASVVSPTTLRESLLNSESQDLYLKTGVPASTQGCEREVRPQEVEDDVFGKE